MVFAPILEFGRKLIEMNPKERLSISLQGKGIAGGQKFIHNGIFFKVFFFFKNFFF